MTAAQLLAWFAVTAVLALVAWVRAYAVHAARPALAPVFVVSVSAVLLLFVAWSP